MNQHHSSHNFEIRKFSWVGLVAAAFIVIVVGFFYFDRGNRISYLIQKAGLWGIGLAILVMTCLCMTPIPSEGLLLLYLKVYGVYWGTFFAWLGSNLSTVVIFVLARYYGQRFMQKLVTAERFAMVDSWVSRKGTLGLFVARLLPIPAFVVNYVAGVMPSVGFWPYLWTAAISIIPYYVGTALVFLGIAKGTWLWLIIGGIGIGAFWSAGYLLNRRKLT